MAKVEALSVHPSHWQASESWARVKHLTGARRRPAAVNISIRRVPFGIPDQRFSRFSQVTFPIGDHRRGDTVADDELIWHAMYEFGSQLILSL